MSLQDNYTVEDEIENSVDVESSDVACAKPAVLDDEGWAICDADQDHPDAEFNAECKNGLSAPVKQDAPDPIVNRRLSSGALTAGMMLATARERQGISLVEVEKATRISCEMIEALENGDESRLPEGPYVLGFVKTYAAFLGLDADTCVRRYRQDHADQKPAARQVYANHNYEIPRPRLNLSSLLFTLLGAGLAFGWYLTTDDGQERFAESFSLGRQNDVVMAQGSADDGGVDAGQAPLDVSVLSETTANQAAAPVRKVAYFISVPDVLGRKTVSYGAERGRLMLVAKDEAWLRVEGTNDGLVFQETLNAGDRYRMADGQSVLVTVRDAGSIDVVVDGVSQGRLGEKGEILMAEPLALDAFLP